MAGTTRPSHITEGERDGESEGRGRERWRVRGKVRGRVRGRKMEGEGKGDGGREVGERGVAGGGDGGEGVGLSIDPPLLTGLCVITAKLAQGVKVVGGWVDRSGSVRMDTYIFISVFPSFLS